MATAFYIDSATNDLTRDSSGHLMLVSGAELTAQRIRIRLRWQFGEWAQDISRGVDYVGQIFVKAPDLEVVRALLLAAVTPVAAVRTLTLERTGTQLLVTLETDDGMIVQEALT